MYIKPMSYVINANKEDFIYDSSATIVSVDDDGAGAFIVLEQDENKIRLDFDEVEYILRAINLLEAHHANMEDVKTCEKTK